LICRETGRLAWNLLTEGHRQRERRLVVKKAAMSMPLLAVCVALSADASNPSNSQIGTATGAVVSGVVGSALTGGSTVGTVGGAAAGALIGHEIGKKVK
jgi:osmotically inducible lipoprotein OsmB